MSARDVAVKILDEARVQIQANMAAHYRTGKGERWVNASGRSSEAFKVVEEEGRVRLVYRGDDVAPLESIQNGDTEAPSVQEAASWREDKMRSGADNLPSPEAIVHNIEARGGTERHHEPQDWIINPVIDMAVQALTDQLPLAMTKDITQLIQ